VRVRLTQFVIALVILFSVPVAFAQNQAACRLNSLLVNVLDQHGNPLSDLHKDYFRVQLNKRPVPISSAEYRVLPRRVVLALDLSGSMRSDPNKWEIARTSVQAFLRMMPQEVRVAFLGFSDRVIVTFEFNRDRSVMLEWLDKINDQKHPLRGPTALYDGLSAALKMLEPHEEGDAIYVITDGQDNSSQSVTGEDLNKDLLKNRVRLFAFLLAEHLPIEGPRKDLEIMSSANETGGFVFGRAAEKSWFLGASFEMNKNVREIIKAQIALFNVQLNGFYSLNFGSSGEVANGSKVSLDVVDQGGKRRKDLVIAFPHRVLGCPLPPAKN